MPGRVEDKVKLVCVKLKPNDTPDKVKSKILKSLRNAERREPDSCTVGHPLESFCEEVHCISDLNASDVVEVASNSRYVAFLTRDGRACRMKCASRAEKHPEVTADLLKRPKQSSFQVLSDAEYARQLQAQFNAERGGGGGGRNLFGSTRTASTLPPVTLSELERRSREYMYLGSIPSPEYHRDPEYYRTLARELSHEGELVTGVGSNVFDTRSLSPPSPFPVLSLTQPLSPSSTYVTFSVGGNSSTEPVSSITPPPTYESLMGGSSSAPAGTPSAPPTAGGEGRDSGGLLGASGLQPGSGGVGGAGGGGGGGGEWRSRRIQWPEMGTLEWAVTKQNPDQPSLDSTFVAMATLHSEILLVGADSRQLYSWPCEDGHGHAPLHPAPHPLSEKLGLSSETCERVSLLSASDIRATVVTESGKVATFYDALLRDCSEDVPPALVRSLTHPVMELPELEPGGGGGRDRIVRLSVANFLTTAVTETGKVYWWGLCPQGKKGGSADDSSGGRTPGVHSGHSFSSSSRGAITDGSLVRMKNGPPCGQNAVVYTKSPTHGPRVGITVNIVEHSRLDPKTTVLVKVFKSGGARASNRSSDRGGALPTGLELPMAMRDDTDRYDGLEVWKLSDVIFLGDSPSVLGRVVTIDQQQVIVDVSYSENASSSGQAASSSGGVSSSLKVFRLSELEPCVDSKATDLPGRSKVKSKRTGSLPSSQQQSLSGTKPVSHHVAGVVQHRPILMLDPTAAVPSHSGDSFSPEETTPTSKILGYKPLAVHATDEGPTLLLQRMTDGRAFLVCSAHAGSGAFVSTSFVAVGTKDSKPMRCTIEEEGVDAFESGLVAKDPFNPSQDAVADCRPPTSVRSAHTESETGGGDSKGREKQKQGAKTGRKRKSRAGEAAVDDTSVTASSMTQHSESTALPSFVSCFGSRVLLLLDANGMVWPLSNGLRLRPPSDRKHGPRAPSQPYASVVSRHYAVTKEENVLVFALIPRSRVLMPAVVAGNAVKVQCILNHLTSQIQVPVPHVPDSESQDSNSSIPAKRMRLNPSPRDGSGPGTEISETAANASLPVQSQEVANLPKASLFESQKNIHQTSSSRPVSMPEDSDETTAGSGKVPATKRIHFPEPDAAVPTPKLRKPTPFSVLDLVKPSERPQPLPPVAAVVPAPAVSRHGSDQVLKIDFDQQMQVVEKETPSVSRPSIEATPIPTRDRPSAVVTSGFIDEMNSCTPDYGLDVLLEATVHNSNILHVCCQLEGGGKGEGAGHKGEELDASDIFRSHAVNHLHYQSITSLPEFQNKSFEELRHQTQGGPAPCPTHHGWSLCRQRMSILEKLLTCKEIRPVIVKLLCSKNAEGSTPFMTAVSRQNYTAALRLLRFVEEVDREQLQNPSASASAPAAVLPMETEAESETRVSGQDSMECDRPNNTSKRARVDSADRTGDKVEAKPKEKTVKGKDRTLLERAILAPMGANVTPVQAVLASVSPFYDGVSMCLHVSSIPVAFSAQHLLKLFQSRYPSAYKAEIFRPGGSGFSSSSESDSDLSDIEENQTGLSGGGGAESGGRGYRPFGGLETRTLSRMAQLRRARARRRRRHRQNASPHIGASVGLPQMGVVHFSDVSQLRAAAREMHDVRLTSSITRNTGFGHTQSISFLGVRLEPESDGDSDDEGGRLPFDEYTPLASLPGSARGRGEGEGEGLRKRAARHANKIATQQLAHQLLLKLLAHTRVATAVGQVGETALASLVHNPKCLSVLNDIRRGIQKGADSHSRNSAGSSGRAFSSLPEWLQHHRERDSGQSGAAGSRSVPQARVSQHIRVVPQFGGTELHQLISDTVSSMLPTLLESQSVPRFGFGIPRPVHPHSHSTSTPIVSSPREGRIALSDFQLEPQSGSLAAEIVITASSPFNAASGSQHSSDRGDGGFRHRDDSRTGEETQSIPPNRSGTETGMEMSQTGFPSSTGQFRFSTPQTLGFGTGNRPGAFGTESRPEATQNQTQEGPTAVRSGPTPNFTVPPRAQECDMLHPLVTNWPCIVTTILGFFPEEEVELLPKMDGPVTSSPRCAGKLLPVHLLDSFTTDLILNCEDSLVNKMVAVVVEKMNEALENADDGASAKVLLESVSIQDCSLSELTGPTLALTVGKRFLNSVMRVLALEHSRVKNALHELQQERMGGAGLEGGAGGRSLGGSSRGGGGDRKRKNVLNTIKHILSSFSWLAVHSLAESAEAAAAPVRLGVSKPLGAHSVSADYHMPRSITPSSFRSSRQTEDPNQVLARQLHVRSALSAAGATSDDIIAAPTPASVAGGTGTPPLPRDGIVMRPNAKDFPGSSNLSQTSDSTAGVSIHDDNFEDFDSEGPDLSDQEHEMEGFGRSEGIRSSLVGQLRYVREAPLPIRLAQAASNVNVIHEVQLDLDTESSSDDEYSIVDDPFGEPSITWNNGQSGVNQEDANLDDIYPFAWALDGRRIGEQSVRNNRPHSPSMLVFGAPPEPTIPLCTIPSIRFGAGFLARSFARFVKDLVDIAQMVCDKKLPQPSVHLPPSLSHALVSSAVSTLERSWQWVVSVLDVAEGQLQQGQLFDSQRYVLSLRGSGHSAGNRPMMRIPPRSFIGSTPGEYITYLLRSHTQEHAQSLPVTDLYGYEHVVYMLDGLIYTLTNWPREAASFASQSVSTVTTSSAQLTNQSMEDDVLVSEPKPSSIAAQQPGGTSGAPQGSRFFVRTESVIIGEEDPETQKSNEQFFGPQGASLQKPNFVGPPNSWGSQAESLSQPLNEAYPLAQQPHLLRPFAKKEHLFSSPPSRKGSMEGRGSEGGGRLPVSYAEQRSDPPSAHPITIHWTIEHALQRWRLAISVFAHIFLAEGPGSERSNFLNARAGFASRMARFRHQVSQLFDASQTSRDWASTVSSTFSLRIRRDHLLQDAIESLQQMLRFHYSQIRVKFEGEEGSGPGVNRGFFASLANELKSSDSLKVPMQRLGLFFHEPGKQPEQSGLFAPMPFIPSAISSTPRNTNIKVDRKNVFRAIGRFLGLCLWFKYTVPFMVCRHVAKFLLGRDLAWHDLAFYNADLYEGLRRMMLDAEEGRKNKEEFMATYCCYFEAPLTGTVEPILVDLIASGSKIPVTPDRVQEYVRLYAMFLMVGCVKDELQAMKEGLTDIIPTELLGGLTAEDFQLLLSGGSANITLSRLKSVIKFNHTHGSTSIICDRFEKMFWRVVSHMNNTQRQQLLYFATGSAALPAGSDSSDRAPALSITIDVIGGGNTESLPVASTCSQRMSLPLYPSYHILKKKLLQAIQCQAYGLG